MRKFLAPLCLFSVLCCGALTAQTPAAPAARSWQMIQALPSGTKVHIKFFHHAKTDCRVTKSDEDSLTCDTSAIFKRVDIESIRANHRVRSTLVGAAMGYGIAFGFTFAASTNNSCSNSLGCGAAVGLVDLGILIVTPIVSHITDFTAGTIYKSPQNP